MTAEIGRHAQRNRGRRLDVRLRKGRPVPVEVERHQLVANRSQVPHPGRAAVFTGQDQPGTIRTERCLQRAGLFGIVQARDQSSGLGLDQSHRSRNRRVRQKPSIR